MLRDTSQGCLWLNPELILGWGGMAGHAGSLTALLGTKFFPVNPSAWCWQPLEKRAGWAQYCPLPHEEGLNPLLQEDRGFNFHSALCLQPGSPGQALPSGSRSDGFSAPVLTRQPGQKCISSLHRPPIKKREDSSISNSPAARQKMENRNKGERGAVAVSSDLSERARPVREQRPLPRAGPEPPRLSQPHGVTGRGAGPTPHCLLSSKTSP